MPDELKEEIKARYAAAARAAKKGAEGDEEVEEKPCCSPAASCCSPSDSAIGYDVLDISRDLYTADEEAEVPAAAKLASLGCGNPVAVAELHPGEVVLDLGSGGGIDVLLSARRVGPTGKAYGLDMTDDMLALARENQRRAGVDNVEFLRGDIEAIPLPDDTADVIISNCVINLALDKDKVMAEAFRVLRPGGRFAVADIVFLGDIAAIPDELRRHVEAWAGCVAGAMGAEEYEERLRRAGFVDASVEVTTVYDDALEVMSGPCCGTGVKLPEGVQLASAFVRARKPEARPAV